MPFLDTGCAELLHGPEVGWDADLRPCGLPLEAVTLHVLPSTDGPVEHLQVQCPRGHRYTHVAPVRARRRGEHVGRGDAHGHAEAA